MTTTATKGDLGPRRVWTLKSFDEAARVGDRQTNGDQTAAAAVTRRCAVVATAAVATAAGKNDDDHH